MVFYFGIPKSLRFSECAAEDLFQFLCICCHLGIIRFSSRISCTLTQSLCCLNHLCVREFTVLAAALSGQHTFQMHMFRYFIPWNDGSYSVITEDRRRWIGQICLRIIIIGFQHILFIMTGTIPMEDTGQSATPFGIRSHILLIIFNTFYRDASGQQRHLPFLLRQTHGGSHTFQI